MEFRKECWPGDPGVNSIQAGVKAKGVERFLRDSLVQEVKDHFLNRMWEAVTHDSQDHKMESMLPGHL